MSALIDYGLKKDGTIFDPEADKEEYCNKCDEVLNGGKIVGGVVAETESSYKDDEYKWIDHKDIIYNRIYKLLCGVAGSMHHEKMKLEAEFITASNFPRNDFGYSPNPGKVYPAVAKEKKRTPTSNASSNKSTESLKVAHPVVCSPITSQPCIHSASMDMAK